MKEGLMLHACCAPDATVPWPELVGGGYRVEVFFYNGNVQPQSEWRLRLDALLTLADTLPGRVHAPAYDTGEWCRATAGYEGEPEGGRRCEICFRLQLGATAALARQCGIEKVSTTLTISPHKDARLINSIGARICEEQGLYWLERIWRKRDGFKRSVARSRELGLYRQNYCGCVHSSRARFTEAAE